MIGKRIIKEFYSVQFFKFLITGGICAAINFFSRFYFQIFFTYVTSVSLGFVSGTFASFILNRQYTFQAHDGRIATQMVKFAMVAIGGVFLGTAIAYICVQLYLLIIGHFLSVSTIESAAHATSIVITAGYNFLAMKYFAFRKVTVLDRRVAISNRLLRVADRKGTLPFPKTDEFQR